MRKKEKIKNRVSALLLSGVIVSGLIAPAFCFNARAEAVEVLNSSCTIADIIFSYCASSGIAITNTTVIDDVYNYLGSSFGTLQSFYDNGLLTYSDGSFIDTGLATNIESTIANIDSFDIGALFNQSAEQNPAGVALSASSTLSGIAGSVSATGVLPLVAGTGAVAFSSFQLGTLIGNYLTKYLPNIQVGAPINTDRDLAYMASVSLGGASFCYLSLGRNLQYRSCSSGMIIACVDKGTYIDYYTLNPTNESLAYRNIRNSSYGSSAVSAKEYTKDSNFRKEFDNANPYDNLAVTVTNMYDSESALLAAFENWKSGINLPDNKVRTPDAIGSDGNIYAVDNDGNVSVPSLTPKIDPDTDSVNPSAIDQDDWNRYADNANDNYVNGNPDDNSDVFESILGSIIIHEPTPNPSPEPQPDPDPDPNPDPNPDPETYPVPGPVPDPSPVPDPDYQPETKPQPDFTEKQTENETDITEGDPWTTPNLLDKFPFCIPKDIYRVFTKLDSKARSAPHIQWRFHPNNMIDHTFDIDFSQWDSIASLLRTLELLAFIVGLAIGTRKLIIGG